MAGRKWRDFEADRAEAKHEQEVRAFLAKALTPWARRQRRRQKAKMAVDSARDSQTVAVLPKPKPGAIHAKRRMGKSKREGQVRSLQTQKKGGPQEEAQAASQPLAANAGNTKVQADNKLPHRTIATRFPI